MKRSIKEIVLRLVILLCGLTIAHLGVSLFVLADLGSDPFNVLVQGIFRTLCDVTKWSFLTHGSLHMTMCLLILVTLLFVDRSYIQIGTAVCMVAGGPIIDFFSAILGGVLNANSPMVIRLASLVIGCFIMAYGMTVVMRADVGVGPNDLVAISISDKLHKKFPVVRVIVDFAFAGIGFALGGTLGVGTIVCAFLVGPVAGIFLPINDKLVNGIVSRLMKKTTA
ncbi:MAG: hypothetical protein IIV87_05305 [Oscillospiraceae bacterium]|nr:hypothetical protein [Oscillospiraceae bacterium]